MAEEVKSKVMLISFPIRHRYEKEKEKKKKGKGKEKENKKKRKNREIQPNTYMQLLVFHLERYI